MYSIEYCEKLVYFVITDILLFLFSLDTINKDTYTWVLKV